MARLVKTMELSAPPKEVFAYMADPARLVEWVTFLTHVHVLDKQVGTDTCVTCSMVVLGKKIAFDAAVTERAEGERFSWESQKHSSLRMKNTLEFSGATVKWTLEYSMGLPLFGSIAELSLLNYFRHEMERSLERVRQEFRTR